MFYLALPFLYVRNVLWGAGFFLGGLFGLYTPHPGQYFKNALLGLDQCCNAILGGDPRETISSRADKARNEGKRWGCVLCKFLGEIASAIKGAPTDHCADALQAQLGRDAVVKD